MPSALVKFQDQKALLVEWVQALESGMFPQTKHVLRSAAQNDDFGGYCCLGVLCEISEVGMWTDAAQWVGKADEDNSDDDELSLLAYMFVTDGEPTEIYGLPHTIQRNLDIIKYVGDIEEEMPPDGWISAQQLATMNDGGSTFIEIARYIRDHYEVFYGESFPLPLPEGAPEEE